jgi:hypothetical protein
MKSHVHTICVAFLAAATLSATVHAQTTAVYRVEVPFEFNCGKNHLGPGTYTITADEPHHTLMIQNEAQSLLVLAQVSYDPGRVGSSKAVFKKYGDLFFFEELKMRGSATDMYLSVSAAERRAARELARQGKQPTELALAVSPERTFGK